MQQARQDRRRRAPRSLLLLALIASALVAVSTVPASAYVSTTITVNGVMSDWTPVLASAGNAVADGQGADDPDNPGTQSRDLDTVASTWDATNLYLYFRRTTVGNNAVSYIAYIDRDGDSRLESTDMVMRIGFNGSNYTGSTLAWYRPVNAAAGDPIGGNGVTPVGTEGGAVAGATLAAAGAANGIEIEARVTWASLQLPPDSGLKLHFSAGRNAGLPGAVEDNTGIQSLRRVAIVLTPDRNYGTAANSFVTYWHTVKNTGNATDTVTYTAASSQGWSVQIFGPDGVTPASSATLAPGASTTLMLRVNVPAGTPKGTEDITAVQAASTLDPTVVDQSTDITFVGPVTVTPPRSGSMAPSGTIEYVHTVRNNTGGADRILLTAVSSSGWPVKIYDASGVTEISRLDLAAGISADIVVRMSVPSTATIGTKDAITVTGTLQSDPLTFGTAIDDTTIAKSFTIAPDNSGISGPNATAQYVHTITNSWMTTRTIDITTASSQGWVVTVFDEDGITPFTTAALGPFGGTRKIVVRVAVPGSATSGTVDTTSVRVRYGGSVMDTATDTTTVGKLATYASAGYVDASTAFHPGETVYARGMGLGGIAAVRFRWIDATGTVVYTSPAVAVDVNQMAASSYSLPTTATLGSWTLVLVNNNGGAEVTRRTFTVSSNAWITLTLDTGSIDYGSLDPGQSSPIHTVSVTVDASGPYTLSTAMSGGVANLGLAVTGNASGLKPGGQRTYSHNFQATPPWTAAPGPATADVQYTAILQ